MMSSPLITLAIPTYNRLHYLKEAVNSCQNQTYNNIEIIIGQDPTPEGPQKDIYEWCCELEGKDNRVKYFLNKENLGLAGNWNALSSAAKGEYIMIIGDDDLLLPECVESLLDGVNIPFTDVIFSNQRVIDSLGEIVNEDYTTLYHRNELSTGLLKDPESAIWKNSVPMSGSLIRATLVKGLKFKEDLNTPEIELYLRIALQGGGFFFTDEYLSYYRVHSGSATSNGLKVHRLYNYLIDIPTRPENAHLKHQFIASGISVAVNKAILEKDKQLAKYFISSHYYHKQGAKKRVIYFIQKFLILLPANTSIALLKFLNSIK